MTPGRMPPWPVLLLYGGIMLFPLTAIVLTAVGIKLTPWPGLLVLSIFIMVGLLVPIVFIVLGIRLTRTRTLIGVVGTSAGTALIVAFGFHLVVGGLAAGGLMLASGVFYTFQAYARISERDSNANDLCRRASIAPVRRYGWTAEIA